MLEEDADEFGVDEVAVEWESDLSESDDSQDQDEEEGEEEEGTASNREPMIPSYRFQEIWRSGQSSTELESLFHPRFMAVISQVAQLTDSFIEPDWDAMEMTISGDNQGEVARAKDLLSTIERHLVSDIAALPPFSKLPLTDQRSTYGPGELPLHWSS